MTCAEAAWEGGPCTARSRTLVQPPGAFHLMFIEEKSGFQRSEETDPGSRNHQTMSDLPSPALCALYTKISAAVQKNSRGNVTDENILERKSDFIKKHWPCPFAPSISVTLDNGVFLSTRLMHVSDACPSNLCGRPPG